MKFRGKKLSLEAEHLLGSYVVPDNGSRLHERRQRIVGPVMRGTNFLAR